MRSREEVLAEFGEQKMTASEGYIAADTHRMADRIAELERTLAALREPSDAVLDAAAAQFDRDPDLHHETVTSMILDAAVRAATTL